MSIGFSYFDHGTLIMLSFILMLSVTCYIAAAVRSNRRFKPWPQHRYFLFMLGMLCFIVSWTGPLANKAHADFTAHMIGHVLLGMISPLCLVLAAPVTLILRTLNVSTARRLSRFLRSRPVQLASHPIVASLLHVGGLGVIYSTNVYAAMHHHLMLYLLVHAHLWLAGWLFTLSIVYIEPTAHRAGFVYRAVIMILAFAAHSFLAKHLYAHPPYGVTPEQAEFGSMLMYYSGDLIEIALICIFMSQWIGKSRIPSTTINI